MDATPEPAATATPIPTPVPTAVPTAMVPPADTSTEADKEALVALFNATGGESWERSDNWLSGAPIGAWFGVSVDPEGRVTVLLLNQNQLSGEIPPELGNLASLIGMDLGWNQLGGEIPWELGNLASLQWLHLDQNQLIGEVPRELGNLARLESL